MLRDVIGLLIPGVREQETRLIGAAIMEAGVNTRPSSQKTVGSILLARVNVGVILAAAGIVIPIHNRIVKLTGVIVVGIIWIVLAAVMLDAGGELILGEAGVLIPWISAGALLHQLTVKLKQELLEERFVIGNQVHMVATVNHCVQM